MKKVEKLVKEYLEERGWDKLRPSDLAKSVTIEAAELLELFQWDNASLEEVKNDPEKLEEIKKELADVFIYALDMAVLLELDTEQIIRDKMEHIKKKYPADVMKKRMEGVDPGTENTYLKIKKEYRKKEL